MKIVRTLACITSLLAVAACTADRTTSVTPIDAPRALSMQHQSRGALDRYLVEYTGNARKLTEAVKASGGRIGRVHEHIGVVEVMGLTADAIMALPGAKYATRDTIVHLIQDVTPLPVEGFPMAVVGYRLNSPPAPAADPTDAYFYGCQWDLKQIHAEEAWDVGAHGEGVKVALLDTGVDPDHVDLVGKVDLAESVSTVSWHDDWCPLDDESTITDYNSHGTGNAAEIASNNVGVASVAPGAQTVAIKVASCTGDGPLGDLLAGLLYAAELDDVSVISMSVYYPIKRGTPGSDRYFGMFQKAANYATQRGKLLIGTAANEGRHLNTLGDSTYIPTLLANVKSAYATDNQDRLASYSNYGVPATWVGAPGGEAWADYEGEPLPSCSILPALQNRMIRACSGHTIDANFPWSVCGNGNDAMYIVAAWGTSYATPEVAGVAALVQALHGGALNPQHLATILAQTADDLGAPGVDQQYSHGRVNAGQAVRR